MESGNRDGGQVWNGTFESKEISKQKEKTGVLYVMNSRQWLTQPFTDLSQLKSEKLLQKPLKKPQVNNK